MINFDKRRSMGIALVVFAAVFLLTAHASVALARPRLSDLYGWLLFVSILFLALYGVRKRLPFLPLLSSETWLQFHIYVGLFTALLFGLHVRWRWPSGWFEGALAAFYALVMLSGFAGLFLSRTLPRRLTTRGSEVVFDLIPVVRRALQEQVEALALKSVADNRSPIIADFYTHQLHGFFARTQNFWLHVFEVRSPLNSLQNKIGDLHRFLNEQERSTLDQIADLVRRKDGLDYQYALQLTLKLWLFVHVPLTYSLLLFTLLHIVLVFAFSGGAR